MNTFIGLDGKSIIREKCIPLNVYSKTLEGTQIKNIIMHPKALEKQEQYKKSIDRKTVKFRAEISDIEMTQISTKKNNETKSWFFVFQTVSLSNK